MRADLPGGQPAGGQRFDTGAGTLDVAIPTLQSGSYFPEWLLERRRRAEARTWDRWRRCF